MRNEAAAVAWILGVFAILVCACSTIPSKGITYGKTGRVELSDEFKNGEARLACDIHCAVTWALYRDRAKALYNTRAWNDLATNVLRIGYADDLSYFYLGKAAEGLGHYRAAEHYYRLSRAASLKCAEIYGDCYGFVFPRDARSAPSAIASNKPAEAKRQNPAPPPPPAVQEPSGPAAQPLNEIYSEHAPVEPPAKEAGEAKYQASPAVRGDGQRAAGTKPPETEKHPAQTAAKKPPAARKPVQPAEAGNSRAEAKPPPEPPPAVAEKHTTEPQAPARPPPVSFEEVSQKFGSHSQFTEAQKREEWKKYQGRCVEWAGELSYVGDSFLRGMTLGFKHDPRTLTYDVLVSAPDDQRAAALRMKKGGHYTYRGTLKKYGGPVLPISLNWGCSAAQARR
ncbi:MAG TPA: hypothetical protein VGH16_04255 [Candidatus Binatia bacterium]